MSVWAIADLHLSFARPDRRERYAERWRDHAAKIEREWRTVVKPADLVLVPGDISMARNHRDLQPDLSWLDGLPGTKVISAGNHDLWWNGVDKIRPMLRNSLLAVGGDAVATHGIIVCGTLGAPVPPENPSLEQVAATDRESNALERSIEAAKALREHEEPIYVLWHYPPFDQQRRPGPWVEQFERAGITACLYGHLHIQGQWSHAAQGKIGAVQYRCVAADAIGFRPLRVDLGARV